MAAHCLPQVHSVATSSRCRIGRRGLTLADPVTSPKPASDVPVTTRDSPHRLTSSVPVKHDHRRGPSPLSAHPGRQPLARHRLGHAAHVHGGARHRHRLGRSALHRRQPLGLELRSHLGADQLPCRQCRHSPRLQLVRPPLRPQALSAHLRRHLHHCVLLLRRGPIPRSHSAGPRSAGSRRRSAAAAVAVHPARKLSHPEALHVHGGLRPRHRCRPGARPHAGRLAHRHLQLALRVLHQHSRRHSGGHS